MFPNFHSLLGDKTSLCLHEVKSSLSLGLKLTKGNPIDLEHGSFNEDGFQDDDVTKGSTIPWQIEFVSKMNTSCD